MDLQLSRQEWVTLQYVGLVWGCFQTWHTAWELLGKFRARSNRDRPQGNDEPQTGGTGTNRER